MTAIMVIGIVDDDFDGDDDDDWDGDGDDDWDGDGDDDWDGDGDGDGLPFGIAALFVVRESQSFH